MATYFPPTENLPIFDSAFFEAANSEGISAAEAAALYLKRTGVATSIASDTQFTGNITLTKAVGPLISSTIDDLSLQSPSGKSMVFYVGAGASSIVINPSGFLTIPSNIRSINSGSVGLLVENQLSNSGGLVVRNLNTASDVIIDATGSARTVSLRIANVAQVSTTSTTTSFAGDIVPRATWNPKTTSMLGYSAVFNATNTGALATTAIFNNIAAGFPINIGVYFFSILIYLNKTVSGGNITLIETGISLLDYTFSGGYTAFVAGQQTYAGAGTDAIVHNVTFTLPVQINTTLYFLTRATHTLANLNNTVNSYIQITRVA